jgi:peptidyl-prolyl cis-trans isomerase A (cyclophilin A)
MDVLRASTRGSRGLGLLGLLLALMMTACSGKSTGDGKPEDAKAGEAKAGGAEAKGDAAIDPALRDPFEANETAPAQYRVKLVTTKGDVVIEVQRDWAPNGADRFYNLVKRGYYTDIAFFRAIAGFMVQFGIHGNPEVNKIWSMAPIKDDPVTQSNEKGMVTFAAKPGKNTRTTHLFINYGNNKSLDGMGFSPIGKVVEGMDVAESLHTGYGEGAPQGKGPAQPEIERGGNTYLREKFPNLDYIERAEILD